MAYQAKHDFLWFKTGQVIDKLENDSWKPFFVKLTEKKVVKKKAESKDKTRTIEPEQ
jgi:hypothetical protein|tara:strand:+ start:8986 stop:9156 length:171 start_codon:yes stop_codon:yes gene_type:complete